MAIYVDFGQTEQMMSKPEQPEQKRRYETKQNNMDVTKNQQTKQLEALISHGDLGGGRGGSPTGRGNAKLQSVDRRMSIPPRQHRHGGLVPGFV